MSSNIFQLFQIIKQSQDDGGDAVTWKVSPVNERLRSLASKHLPRTTRVFAEASGISGSILQPCSEIVKHSRSPENQSMVVGFLFFFFSFDFWIYLEFDVLLITAACPFVVVFTRNNFWLI